MDAATATIDNNDRDNDDSARKIIRVGSRQSKVRQVVCIVCVI